MILEQFDPAKSAVINPWNIVKPIEDMPKVAVCCYSRVTFERMIHGMEAERIGESGSANIRIPVYRIRYRDVEIAAFMIGVGAPMSVAMLEEVFQMGVETVIVFGTCGVLDRSIDDCSIIIPDTAVRDEGTSYHYAPPSDEISVNETYMDLLKELLDQMHIKYVVGKAWTTDAFYRETASKVKLRKEQGCICVDMECSANVAITQFRGKELIQFFYAADNLDNESWDARSLSNHAKVEEKDRIAVVALETAYMVSTIGRNIP